MLSIVGISVFLAESEQNSISAPSSSLRKGFSRSFLSDKTLVFRRPRVVKVMSLPITIPPNTGQLHFNILILNI